MSWRCHHTCPRVRLPVNANLDASWPHADLNRRNANQVDTRWRWLETAGENSNWFISQHGQSTMRAVPRVRLELSKKTCRKVSSESIGVNLRYLLKWRNCTKSTKWQAVRLPCMPVDLRRPSYTVKPLDICELTMGVTRRQHRTRPSPLPPELGRGHSLRCINKTF